MKSIVLSTLILTALPVAAEELSGPVIRFPLPGDSDTSSQSTIDKTLQEKLERLTDSASEAESDTDQASSHEGPFGPPYTGEISEISEDPYETTHFDCSIETNSFGTLKFSLLKYIGDDPDKQNLGGISFEHLQEQSTHLDIKIAPPTKPEEDDRSSMGFTYDGISWTIRFSDTSNQISVTLAPQKVLILPNGNLTRIYQENPKGKCE